VNVSALRAPLPGIVIGALAAATLTACSAVGGGQHVREASVTTPQRIVAAPKDLLAAGQPQPNGSLWALAGDGAGAGLFDISLASGKGAGSISVSSAARSVTESLTGVVGLALGTPDPARWNCSTGAPARSPVPSRSAPRRGMSSSAATAPPSTR
jgi:hypothetical protein